MDEYNPLDLFSEETKRVITNISNKSSKSIDELIKVQEASDKSHKLHSLLLSWENQQNEERKLRKLYSICFLVFLGIQLVLLNISFFFIGIKVITINDIQFNVFYGSMFGEIAALVLIVTRYLFPLKRDGKFLDMLKDL